VSNNRAGTLEAGRNVKKIPERPRRTRNAVAEETVSGSTSENSDIHGNRNFSHWGGENVMKGRKEKTGPKRKRKSTLLSSTPREGTTKV